MFTVRFFDSNNGVCVGDGTSGNAEIYTTTNGGAVWTLVPSSNIPLLQSEGFIPSNSWVVGNTIWLPTNGGSLFKSSDRGLTWNVTRAVVSVGGSYCAFKDTLNGLLSGSLAGVVKRTTDGGATWTPTESVPSGISTLFMSYMPGTSGWYVITAAPPHGPSPGSAITRDNGATWTEVDRLQHGRAAFVSYSLGWSWGGANVIYRWDIVGSVSEPRSDSPSLFELDQNYPNPFNPTTVIRYQLSAVSEVRLTVHDLLGREVAVLVNERKAVGSYEVKFDGAGLASGVYFYRLQTGEFVQTRKLLLLR